MALAVMSKSNPTLLNVPYYYGICKPFLRIFFGRAGTRRKEPVAGNGSSSEKGGFDTIDKINWISLNKGVCGLRSAQAVDGEEDRD